MSNQDRNNPLWFQFRIRRGTCSDWIVGGVGGL